MQTERVIGIYLTLVALVTAAQAVIYPRTDLSPTARPPVARPQFGM